MPSSGTRALIWFGLMYEMYAGVPLMRTETPSNETGRLPPAKSDPAQARVEGAKAVHRIEIQADGAIPAHICSGDMARACPAASIGFSEPTDPRA